MQEIIESLSGTGYQGECLQASVIEEILDNETISIQFRSLICWITGELSILLNMDEQIHPESEATEFALELSSLLKELSCPYSVLISGPTQHRFQSKQDRLLLLNYLLSELMAAKMSHKLNPHKKVVIEILESPPAIALKAITQNLSLGKPPPNITPKAFFEKLLNKFSEIFKKNEQVWGKTLFAPSRSLTFEEWTKLEKLRNELDNEYDLRRDMLLTRLDVTIQSFQWSDAAKNKGNIIAECYSNKRQELDHILHRNKATDIIELLAARDDVLHVEKTSSANMRKNTQCDIQKHIIGMVPDRGGRANEHQIPPPEMPAWQKNRNQSGQGNQGGGNRGGLNYKGQIPQQQRANFQQNYQPQGSHHNSGNYSGNNFKHQNSGTGDSNFYNNNRGGNNSRVQGAWSQSGGGNQSNENFRNYNQGQHRTDNYYGSSGNPSAGSNRSNFYGQNQSQDYNRKGDGYNRGQSNYNRGGRR